MRRVVLLATLAAIAVAAWHVVPRIEGTRTTRPRPERTATASPPALRPPSAPSAPSGVQDDALLQNIVDQSIVDLRAAAAAADELPPGKRQAALARIAATLAARDIRTALAEAARIDDDRTRAELFGHLTRAWSAVDAEAMLAYAATLDAPHARDARDAAALQAFVELDSASAVDLAAAIPGSLGDMLERAALLKLSRNDPLASVRHASAMPAGPERDAALRAAARGYARADPEAALVWAEQLDPPAPAAVANVLTELGKADPQRAVEGLLALDSARDRSDALAALVRGGTLPADLAATVADRLAAEPRDDTSVRVFTRAWAERSPESALGWLLANPHAAPPSALADVAERLARTNPAAALAYRSRVPADAAPAWLAGVAAGYAHADPRAARAWVAELRGQPGYERALAAIERQLAR